MKFIIGVEQPMFVTLSRLVDRFRSSNHIPPSVGWVERTAKPIMGRGRDGFRKPLNPSHGTARFHGAAQLVGPIVAVAFLVMTSPAFAHSEKGEAIDFWGGFTHPIFGLDHVVAMVAVGLWGAFLGAPAIWMLPVVFPLVMAFAGALGVLGVPMVGVETGIALSAIALGAMVAFAAKPPLWVAAALVGAFAVFHGYAHGAELPIGADAIAFSMGFVIATGMLHLAGIAFGALSHWPAGRVAVRGAGAVIALIGFGFLTGVV
jgi:urease accessory protein